MYSQSKTWHDAFVPSSSSDNKTVTRNDKLKRESVTQREKLNKRDMIGGNNARRGPRYASALCDQTKNTKSGK